MSALEPHKDLLEATLSKLFIKFCAPDRRRGFGDDEWAHSCWNAMDEAGLIWLGVPEEARGSGGDFSDACALLFLAGRYAVPLPLAECSLLGGWLAATTGLQIPGGPLAVAPPHLPNALVLDDENCVSGRLDRVPWGQKVDTVVGLAASRSGARVVLLRSADAEVQPGWNLAGERRDTLTWTQDAVSLDRISRDPNDLAWELELRGALSRSLLMAGVMESIVERTIDYASERRQFGRPIAAFQAVAHSLVRMTSEAELATLATDVAARRFAELGPGAAFEVAVSKVVTSRAVMEVSRRAHQIHGAIGMTQEYPLHHFTRRLWAWRQEWGSERHWAQVAGRIATTVGASELWPRVATGLVESRRIAER